MKLNTIYRNLIIENNLNGKHLLVIDVQPEYQYGFKHWLNEFINLINKNYKTFNNITLFFNGPDLGMIDENKYRHWWFENGLKENIAFNIKMYDKGYAFFRYCIDSNIEHQSTVNLIKFMYENNINDSRDLDDEFWNEFISEYGDNDVRELLEFSDDCVNLPELMDELKKYGDNLIICGGGVNECLKEVEIALDALGKPYQILEKYTY